MPLTRATAMDAWVDRELGGDFPDPRLRARLGKTLGDLGRRVGGTLPAACQDWSTTKSAYRFFSNPRVDEGVPLAGHFAATGARFAATTSPVLVHHDMTEFSIERDSPEALGWISPLVAADAGFPPARAPISLLTYIATPARSPRGVACPPVVPPADLGHGRRFCESGEGWDRWLAFGPYATELECLRTHRQTPLPRTAVHDAPGMI